MMFGIVLAKSDVNWGSVPEWAAGIGTVGAILLAVVVAVTEHRRAVASDHRAAESDRRLEELQLQTQEERRVEHARLLRGKLDNSGGFAAQYSDWRYTVVNESPEPFFNIVVTLSWEHGQQSDSDCRQVLAPGESWTVQAREELSEERRDASPPTSHVQYGDHLGGHWLRDAYGRVRRSKVEPQS